MEQRLRNLMPPPAPIYNFISTSTDVGNGHISKGGGGWTPAANNPPLPTLPSQQPPSSIGDFELPTLPGRQAPGSSVAPTDRGFHGDLSMRSSSPPAPPLEENNNTMISGAIADFLRNPHYRKMSQIRAAMAEIKGASSNNNQTVMDLLTKSPDWFSSCGLPNELVPPFLHSVRQFLKAEAATRTYEGLVEMMPQQLEEIEDDESMAGQALVGM